MRSRAHALPDQAEIRQLLQSAMAACALRRMRRFFACLVLDPEKAARWSERVQVALEISQHRAPFVDSRALICWTFMKAHQLWLQAAPPAAAADCVFCQLLPEEGGLTAAERSLIASSPPGAEGRLVPCSLGTRPVPAVHCPEWFLPSQDAAPGLGRYSTGSRPTTRDAA